MAIAMTLKQFLDQHGVSYDTMRHNRTGCSSLTAQASHVSGDCIAKGIILRREDGYIMAIVPASRHVDLPQVQGCLAQPVGLASEEELSTLFADCDVGAVPALAKAYGLDAMVDESLDNASDIYIEGGDHRTLVHLRGPDFRELMSDMPHVRISC